MVNKIIKFKKGKGKKNFKKDGKGVVASGKSVAGKKLKNGFKSETECFYCKGSGYWKRNCFKYLADKKVGNIKGICDIYVIDVYFISIRSSFWVFDTGAVVYICNLKQELRNKRRLAKDEVTMRVGNGFKVDVIVVGTLFLYLFTGLVLNFNNCYLVSVLSMNIVSGFRLMRDGYLFKFENNGCFIYMRDMFYGYVSLVNGLFLMNFERDVIYVYSVNIKRCKVDNDSVIYLWYCRFGYIGVKRMKKFYADGFLEFFDYELFDTCELCFMGKMIKIPFFGIMERVINLLEIIYTDVCGLMSVEVRGGYRYVFIFIDDLSRYGYVYLMKYKSEIFEKFKEFQSEVEN